MKNLIIFIILSVIALAFVFTSSLDENKIPTIKNQISKEKKIKSQLKIKEKIIIKKDKDIKSPETIISKSKKSNEIKIIKKITKITKTKKLKPEKKKIEKKVSEIKSICDIPLPDGYKRVNYNKDSFSYFLQHLPLKKDKDIKMYNGKFVNPNYYNRLAVVKMNLLYNRDLEQCADFCMRFWGEYHKKEGKLKKLYLFTYDGKKRYLKYSKKGFIKFLKSAMAGSNSHSIKKGCKTIKSNELKPGDMFTQNSNGGIGHVSMIVDECQNIKTGDKLYLIGFSFMPAQEFHIEKATYPYGKNGWFSYEGYINFLNRNFPYGKPVLRRF